MARLIIGDRVSRVRLLYYGVGVAAIVLAAALAWLMSKSRLDPIFVFGGLAGLIGLAVMYKLSRFEYGLMTVLLAAGLINFFSLPTGRDSRVVISLAISLVLLVIWGYQLAFTHVTGVRIRPSPVNKPLLAFVFINILAYVWSLLMRDPLLFIWPSFPVVQVAALMVNITLPLMALLTANKFTQVKWLKMMAWVVISLGVLNIVSRLFALPTIVLIENGSRGLFPAWVAMTACALAYFDQSLKRWQRAALFTLVVAYVFQYFFRDRLWVSGWLPMFVGIGALTFFYSKRAFVVLCVVALIVGFDRLDDLYNTIVVANVNEGGLQRLDLWQVSLQHVANHPIFGMGPAGYAIYYMTYNPENSRSTHNNYFDVLAQNGVIGFICFVILLIAFLRVGWVVRRTLAGRRDFSEAFASTALAGCVAVVIGMMLGDWVLPFAYNQTISGFDNAIFTWMMLGGMVALHRIVREREPMPRAATGASRTRQVK